MNVILHERFQHKLQEAMTSRGWTQSELARRMGIAQPVVHRYLTGDRCPGLDMVERFADALGVIPHNLVDDRPIRLLATVES